MKRLLIILLFISATLNSCFAQNLLLQADQEAMQQWVDSMMQLLTPEQRLGQLLMPQVVGGNTPQVQASIKKDLNSYHVGGFFFSKGTIASQNALTRYAQREAKESAAACAQTPLLIGIDGEWGLAMRLSDASKFPRNKALSNINPSVRDTICYLYGREVARECRILGIHINFAPVLDINSNPNNPVIGTRSFGATVEEVVTPALSYAHGLEDGGVLSTGKHFPGHGDTDTDSHLALPRLSHSKELMTERELKPFAEFANAGLGAIMVAHLDVPSLSEEEGMPSTASKQIVTGILRNEYGFEGLVITDGLAMKGASNYPDICTKALLAGNDILLQPYPIDKQWNELIAARDRGDLPQELIDEKCRRVLAWKYALIINNPIKEQSISRNIPLEKKINSPEALKLLELINRLVADSTATLPEHDPTAPEIDPTLQTDTALAVKQEPEHSVTQLPANSDPRFKELESIIQEAFDMGAFPGCQVLVAQRGEILYNRCFGNISADSQEPVLPTTRYDLASLTKAAGTIPAVMLAVDKYNLKLTDCLSKYIPELKGTDKANITVQQALFHETGLPSGYPFYGMTIDSASVDSQLYKNKMIDPHIIQQDTRTWFHKGLKFNKYWISSTRSNEYPLTIAKDMYIKAEMRDSIMARIARAKLRAPGRYRYSDLNFVLLRAAVEKVSKKTIDQLLYTELPELYNDSFGYQPLEHGVAIEEIAPTENDLALRHQYLRGYVHDELAAWSGGVEGNAGLFGSATKLFPIVQMLLDNGRWEDKQLISEATVRTFTTRKSKVSRRGLGFDKPETNPKKSNPCYKGCSTRVYGHTGFTGSCFWVDPNQQSIFIFICNRVNPHRWNKKLTSENFRPRMQEAVYKALK